MDIFIPMVIIFVHTSQEESVVYVIIKIRGYQILILTCPELRPSFFNDGLILFSTAFKRFFVMSGYSFR